MRTFIACVLGALLFAFAAPSVAAPLVQIDDYVVDRADILPADREAALIQRLRAFENETSNQVVVVTVPTLEGQALEEAALEIVRTAGVGQADKDNGVLLLIALAERRIRIEVGYGLEGALPDGLAGQIIGREIGPRFKAGDLAGGVEAGVDAILAATKGEYEAAPRDVADRPWVPFAMVGLWIAFIFLIRLRKGRRRRRRGALGAAIGGGVLGASYGRGGWGGGGFGGGNFGGGGFSGGGGSGGGGGASGGW